MTHRNPRNSGLRTALPENAPFTYSYVSNRVDSRMSTPATLAHHQNTGDHS